MGVGRERERAFLNAEKEDTEWLLVRMGIERERERGGRSEVVVPKEERKNEKRKEGDGENKKREKGGGNVVRTSGGVRGGWGWEGKNEKVRCVRGRK